MAAALKRGKPLRGRARSAARPRLDSHDLGAFGRKLRAWYTRNARDLPWRRSRDPYEILVSELMLQQTQVSRVLEYWARFLQRFPTLRSLADARESHVLKAWAGLGYYARARNLHKLSRAVVREGPAAWGDDSFTTGHTRTARDVPDVGRVLPLLPADPAQLRKLPGIGAYTAGAVATFAFERRAALVDTNVARVLTRVFAPRLHPKRGRDQKAIWAIAEATLPRTGKATWTHNQALMELGALVCTARVKRCAKCPVRSVCRSVEPSSPAEA